MGQGGQGREHQAGVSGLMPISILTLSATTPSPGANYRVQRTAHGVVLDFPPCRAPGVALGLLAFALVCGLMPALGLGALLPLKNVDAEALVSLALIGGFAAPFILACTVFALLAIYQLTNALHVEVSASGIRTERRLFGRVIKRAEIAHADIADIEPRIHARFQNVFSRTPRYALIAKHRTERSNDVVVAEDVPGQTHMTALLAILTELKKI